MKAPQHRQRNIDRGDDGGAQIAEKENQYQEDQHHPERQILQHGVQRRMDQTRAIVIRDYFVAFRQHPGGVELLDLRLDPLSVSSVLPPLRIRTIPSTTSS